MITYSENGVHFNYRVVGIALHGGYVLLHTSPKDDFWSLPGGRGELMEPSAETLRREMMEELGESVTVERLVWVVENFFRYNGERFHELALYYLMTFAPDSHLLDTAAEFQGHEFDMPLTFRWFPVDGLSDITLYPIFLKEGLTALPSATEHVIHVNPPDADLLA